MTVRGTTTAFQTAMDAAVARDASPVQSGDITTWDPIRQMLLDLIETALDEATMRGVVLGASVIIENYLADGAVTETKIGDGEVTRTKLDTNSVSSDAIITSGAHSAGTGIRDALQGLAPADQLSALFINGLRTDAQVRTLANGRIATWARAVSPSGRMPVARALGSTVVSGQFGNRSGDSRKSLLLTQAGGGTVAAPIDQIIADVLTDMVTGNTETNITVTVSGTGANAKLNFVATGGGTTPPPSLPTHQIYAAYGADNTWVASDFTVAGPMQASTTNGTLTLSGATGRAYVAFWSAEQLTVINPVNRLALPPTDNDISNYTESRLTISSVNGYLYTGSTDAPAGYINGEWRFA